MSFFISTLLKSINFVHRYYTGWVGGWVYRNMFGWLVGCVLCAVCVLWTK